MRRTVPVLKELLLVLVLGVLVLGSYLGCQSQSTGRVYRIGLGPWVGFGPLYLAQEKGFFQEVGIKVELIVLAGLSERNSALKSGKLDALAAPVDYFVQSAGNHLETTIVMAIDESVGGDGIVANSSIQRVEDLRGKRVAFQRGLPSEFFLRALLYQHKMRLDDLNTVDMETAQAGAAFLTKRLDAAVLWEPWLTKAREEGNGHKLASTREYPNLIVDALAFNKNVVARYPQDVQGIVNAILKAIEYWKEHPQDANKIMAPYFQVDAVKYAEILRGLKFCGLNRNREYFGSAGSPRPIFDIAERASAIWQEAKVIITPVKPESVISVKFVTEAK